MSHARKSDPLSSHIRLGQLRKDESLRELVVRAAMSLEHEGRDAWSDSDLWFRVEHLSRKRQQRNIIARARGLLERDGVFERVDVTAMGKLLLFKISGDSSAPLPLSGNPS